ncbi:MAG: tetratricopeptide repeat protein [Pirellulales bacterium]|nr:tetratricopeptide repeat protein [Pirellulales bacterium]
MKRYGLHIALVVALGALTAIGYYQVAWNDWVGYDDAVYVTQNPTVRKGLTWESFRWSWVSTRGANWHPLTMLSHMTDVTLFGLWAGGHYLTNLAFHLANVVLLYFGLQYLVRSGPRVAEEPIGAADAALPWKAAFVAAMFAIHPLHVESVAWVAERKDVLSTFFFLLALLAYGWYTRRPSFGRMALVTMLMALGLLAKPMLVTLPAVLLLLDYWPLGRLSLDGNRWRGSWRRLVLEKAPLFFLSALSSIITYKVQNTSGAVRHFTHLTIDDRIANCLMAYAGYLGQMVWPLKLAAFYPHPGKYLLTRPEYLVKSSVALVVIVAATALAVWLRRTRPYLAVGWFWYLGTLVPVIGIVQVGSQSMADRYTYIPLIGIFVAVAWGVPDLLARVPAHRAVVALAAFGSVVACTWLTWHQVQTWKSDYALWSNVLKVVGDDPHAHCGVATPLANAGKLDEAYEHCKKALALDSNDPFVLHCYAAVMYEKEDYEASLEYFNLTIQRNPNKALAYSGRAAAYRKLNRLQDAAEDYRRAAQLEPNEGIFYLELGRVNLDLKRYPMAEQAFERAIECNPEDADSYAGLGNLHARLGHKEKAIALYRRVLEIAPNSHEIREYLAGLLLETGQTKEASDEYARLAERQPASADYASNLARAALESKQFDLAVEKYREATRLEPAVAQHQLGLAAALARQGRDLDAAIEACQVALAIDAESTSAYYQLAEIHSRQNDWEAAAADYEAVLRIKPDSLDAANNLAWLLATHDDAAPQSSRRAVELAEQICTATEQKDHSYLDTLAAAYAQAGRFEDAVRTARLAVERARAARQEAMAEQINSRLRLYEAGQPFREA